MNGRRVAPVFILLVDIGGRQARKFYSNKYIIDQSSVIMKGTYQYEKGKCFIQ